MVVPYKYTTNINFKMKMVNWLWKKPTDKKEPQQQINEQELKKKGFDPEGLEIEPVKDSEMQYHDQDYEGFITPTPEQTKDIVDSYKFFPNNQDHRHPLGYKNGGKICGLKSQVNCIRSIGKEMIKIVGKKIITGDLNLTRISFPIKAMVPKTALENSTLSCCMNPYFMKMASQTKDPVQRMKFIITNTMSAFYYMNLFLKPLNPVIGETLQGSYPDGTQIYCEQVSHHPPISYFLAVGPEGSYRYYGNYNFSAHAGLNSMSLVNKGTKHYEFPDGSMVEASFNKQMYSGVFMGTLRSEATDSVYFKDVKNDLKAEIVFGKVKKRPTDYFESTIYKGGKAVCKFDGTYCGYINFDGVRYWDGRYLKSFRIILDENTLDSDFRRRIDLQHLKANRLEQAQKAKEEIEEIQRRDVKLREKLGPKK